MDIVEVDVHDEAALRECHAVGSASIAHDRPHAVSRTIDALADWVREPSAWHRAVLFAACDDGCMVGVAELGLSLQDNTHLADLEIHVLPQIRRRGIGRALHAAADRRRLAEGRTSLLCEVFVPVGRSDSPGLAFARELGYVSVHVEDHLMLPLPMPGDAVLALAERVVTSSEAYELLTWVNRCPDELAAEYCQLRTRMSDDMPIGEIDYQPIVYTEERMRAEEERIARSYVQVVAAARCRSDGVLGGYSQVCLAHGTDRAYQDDTLVMPEHRGHRLGTALKLATLEIVQRDHPGRRTFHTWTDPDNRAMYRTNTDFGFVPVERMHEMQRKDG
jgi:GNAT superfamily N-acetyltransferase